MAKKRSDDGGGGGDSWLNTYADMVTLLLTFFAVMLSMSNTDEQKFNAFIKSFSALPQEVIEEIVGNSNENELIEGETPSVSALNDLYLSLQKYVEENNQGDAVEISTEDDIVYIRFNSMMFFKPDEYTLLEESIPTLDFIGEGLKKYEKKIRSISVCGHTANIAGFGTSNVSEWFLSSDRAAAVLVYFEEQKKIEAPNMISIGYGGKLPMADNSTEAGRTKNRRVELVIVGTESAFDFNAADPTGKISSAENPADKAAKDKGTSSKVAEKPASASSNTAATSEAASVSGTAESKLEETSGVASTATSSTSETSSYEE